MLKAEKRKHADFSDRIRKVQDELFPRKGLQERNLNFSEFYVEFGEALIPALLQNLKPLSQEFLVLEVDS